jgi:integrase
MPTPEEREVPEIRDLTIDEAIETFLIDHLADEKGREARTVNDYRKLHLRWFSPVIGSKKVKVVDEQMVDDIFGHMRRSGLSRSRMNQAKSLYGPFFRWAMSRRIISRNPMASFQLPTSKQVSKERLPPEVEELTIFLNAALNEVPDITPVLVLAAVTGMRRGELVGLRRSRIDWSSNRLTVDTAIGTQQSVKHTKTRTERTFYVDNETIGMLRRQCDAMDERAQLFGTTVAKTGYVFSLEPDCSKAMSPDYVTKRVAELKDFLGISVKRPDVAALEDKALALRRQAPVSRKGRTGPAPTGGLSFADIGKKLDRSEKWAALAVKSAERREAALLRGIDLDFDGSIIALRKFTSSELLDAGFNVSLVAQRQGHGPQVLVKHYSKGRKSADRKAAEHLGRVVHASGSSA